MIFPFRRVICRFHVTFRGSTIGMSQNWASWKIGHFQIIFWSWSWPIYSFAKLLCKGMAKCPPGKERHVIFVEILRVITIPHVLRDQTDPSANLLPISVVSHHQIASSSSQFLKNNHQKVPQKGPDTSINIFAPKNQASWKMILSFWGKRLFSEIFCYWFQGVYPVIPSTHCYLTQNHWVFPRFYGINAFSIKTWLSNLEGTIPYIQPRILFNHIPSNAFSYHTLTPCPAFRARRISAAALGP